MKKERVAIIDTLILLISEISSKFNQNTQTVPTCKRQPFFKIVFGKQNWAWWKTHCIIFIRHSSKDINAHLTRFSYNLFVFLSAVGTNRILSIFI